MKHPLPHALMIHVVIADRIHFELSVFEDCEPTLLPYDLAPFRE